MNCQLSIANSLFFSAKILASHTPAKKVCNSRTSFFFSDTQPLTLQCN